MEKIEAGLLKKLLDTIKNISEALFNYLGASDLEKSNMQIDEKSVKKKSENVYSLSGSYIEKNGSKASTPLPFELIITLPDGETSKNKVLKDKEAILPKIEVSVSIPNDDKIKNYATNVRVADMWATAEKLLLAKLDDDTKYSFGIKASRTMQVTLQRVVGAKETSINLTGIKANYILGEAYSDLDTLLDSEEFTEAITEEPVSFEIVEYDDEFDVNPIDIQQNEYTAYSIQQILCAAVQFYMDIQLLRWESARNEHLFNALGSQLYSAQNWVDKLGLWNIEVSNSVCNVLGGCYPDLGENIDITSEHSPCVEYAISMDCVFPVFDRIINTIEWNYPNLPTDMQQDLNWWLRELKRTRDFDLKQD